MRRLTRAAAARSDFDNYWDLDVLIMNTNEVPSLLRNDIRSENHWLKVRVIGTTSNRSAIGTRVTVRYGARHQVQELAAQLSFCSVNDPACISVSAKPFRLISQSVGRMVEICRSTLWPQLITIREGKGVVRTERLRRS